MKRRRVVKLFSLSMAAMVAVSSGNIAGSVAYAEEVVSKEETVQEEVVEEGESVQEKDEDETKENQDSSVEEGISEVESAEEGTTEEMTVEKTSEEMTTEEENTEKETTEEETSEEATTEEGTTELETSEEATIEEETTEEETTEEETPHEVTTEEINKDIALSEVTLESVTLTQFYGKELEFDYTSTWSDQGENNLGLTSEKALNSGATVSFDMYIPEEMADYNGVIKVQGVARLGDNWAWIENKSIPEYMAANFTETVEIDGNLYKKANVSFTFGDEIEADYLADFTVKLAGWQCNYKGNIYYANVELEDGAAQEDTGVEEAVTLNQFYAEDVAFDSSSDWDDKGECHLGLTSEAALKTGTTVSFDLYIPEEKASYNGIIKVQGIARLGDNWDWVQNEAIPEFKAADFTETVEMAGKTYKKAKVSFTFGDEITADRLAEFTVKLAGYQCDYAGPVYYANVEFIDGEEKDDASTEVVANALYHWDFAQGIDGWQFDGVWDNKGENSIEWNEQYQALAMNVDYSKDATSTWSEIKSSFWGDEFKVEGANKMTFDFIYDSAEMQQGSFKTKLFSNSGIDTNVSISLENAEAYDGTLKKVQVTLSYDDTDIENGITIGIIGSETDYQGVVYLDNVTLIAEEKAEVTDIYVDATEVVTGQNVVLSVQGNTLTTGAGSADIAQNITLVDANATDSVKQVYAYLQAVGKTDGVIFGQQNNTSHKAGGSNLSCSDTMDLVGSYTGIIGLDGLSLVGNEYSAERYLNEMADIDSAYDSVAAKIAQAQTTIEKNVIAAAALTNFNIRNGAIATLSLHTPNLSVVSRVDAQEGAPSYAAYDFSGYTPGVLTGDVMNQILPGGAYHAAFTAYLDMVADYAKQVEGAILFRPFHENTGSWFWWGAAFCDAQTYKSVFKYTVEYLRDEKDVHNLLYVYGPGAEAANVEEYAERYPGDGYVDMVGFDMYHDNPAQGDAFITNFTKELFVVESFAKAHGKLVAVTETGTRHETAEGDNQTAMLKQNNARPDWHQEILDVVKTSEASYYLVWANFSEKDGFYTPYVKSVNEDGVKHGHEMMDNFIRFFNQNNTIFAVNQKQALEQMQSVAIEAEAAMKQDGYVISPVAGTRVLEATTLTAKVSGVSVEDEVVFVCKGVEETRTLEAQYDNGYCTAALNADDLAAMGETVGQITLQINGKAVDTIRVTFNIPVPVEDPYEIDGFENYFGIDSLLTKSWATNKATGSTIELSVVKDAVNEGDYAMKFAYNETSDGWAGATISKEVSWADCDALSFWTIPDGKQQKTVIQITANGNVYEYYLNLNEDYAAAGTKAVRVTIPFAEFVARDISGNPSGGLVQDKGSITSFGLWVNAIAGSEAIDENGMVSGTIYYDSITAVFAGLDTAKVELAEEAKPEVKPEDTPSQEGNDTTVSKTDDDSDDVNTANVVDTRVFPTFTSVDGKKVSGWENVVTAAYELSELTANRVPLANTLGTVTDRLLVNINVADVTELVIPTTAVRKMAVSGADYNIFMGTSVITLTNEILADIEGSLDLKLYVREAKDFGDGFDAMFISSRTRLKLTQQTNMNVVLGTDKIGKQVYIYQFVEETHSYELLMTQTVSEIGTVCIPVDEYVSCLILY